MVFIYLSLGIALVVLIHKSFGFLATAEPKNIRKSMSWFAVILVIALIILFLRFGLPHMAAITSFGAVAIAWIRRLRQAKISVNKANAAFKKKTAEHIMHTDEARSILGLEANATAEDINKAHHQLIQKNHPDTGGSEYLASKINEARDVLLKELSK